VISIDSQIRSEILSIRSFLLEDENGKVRNLMDL